MFRIDSAGATPGNRFTEGDPGLSIPATVVSDEFLNNVQEEIILPIEKMGIALDKLDEGQLWQAFLEFQLRGGREKPFRDAIPNNSNNVDLEDSNNADALLTIDRTIHRSIFLDFDVERKTDAGLVKEFGTIILSYDSKNDVFLTPKVMSSGDDAGLTFKLIQIGVTDVFKLAYDSDDLAGGTYIGTIDITNIRQIKQA